MPCALSSSSEQEDLVGYFVEYEEDYLVLASDHQLAWDNYAVNV